MSEPVDKREPFDKIRDCVLPWVWWAYFNINRNNGIDVAKAADIATTAQTSVQVYLRA